ncbi:MAG: TatD family hydrolase [Methylotenera sp.]|nr:TatD family hydrolase [Oligoflexia bacterium]
MSIQLALPTLIDTHCHLDYDYAPKSEAELVQEAHAAGVSHLVTIGTEMASIEKLPLISARYPHVYHTVGIHPHEAVTFKDGDLELLREAAKHPKCRAIGEIGLDYHYDHSAPEVQKKVLEMQLTLALEVKQPIVIHSREGEEDLLIALTRYAKQVPAGAPVGIIHCFTGTRAFGEACLKLGFLISFSGIITFKKADDLRALVKDFPLNQILVETDSPYLAPIPNRGRKCEPSMVKLTAMKVAELKGISLEDVALTTTQTAKKFFRIAD